MIKKKKGVSYKEIQKNSTLDIYINKKDGEKKCVKHMKQKNEVKLD